jgi:Fe-S-cluster-containing hydrogenase component 2
MKHEGWMWPEASRVRVFMPFPGVEVPHLCAQCKDYPCVGSCPTQALSTDADTGAVLVERRSASAAEMHKGLPRKRADTPPGRQ